MDENNNEADLQDQSTPAEAAERRPSTTTQKTHKFRKILNALLGITIGAIIPIGVVIITTFALWQNGYLNPKYDEMIASIFGPNTPEILNETKSYTWIYGTPIDYKTGGSWKERLLVSDYDLIATYSSRRGIINIHITDPNTFSSESSADEWINNQVDYYDRSEEFSLEEFERIDTKTINNHEFNIYKQTVIRTMPDADHTKKKANNPDLEQSETTTSYYAILKNENIDLEIYSTNQALVNEFLNGLTIGE